MESTNTTISRHGRLWKELTLVRIGLESIKEEGVPFTGSREHVRRAVSSMYIELYFSPEYFAGATHGGSTPTAGS